MKRLALLLLLLAACAPVATPQPSAPPAPTVPELEETQERREPYPPETFAVIWRDAALYRHPGDPDPLRAWSFGTSPRSARPGEGFVVRLLERRGPWRKVATGARWRDDTGRSVHCVEHGVVAENRIELDLWVHATDLMPVVSRTVEQRHDDGSYAIVVPGTPVADGHPWAAGFALPVDLEPSMVGDAYQPPASVTRVARAEGTFEYVVAPHPRLTLGGREVSWTKPLGVLSETHEVHIDGDRAYVVWERCGAAEFVLEGDFEPVGGLRGVFGELGESKDHAAGAVEPSTRLYWPDGSTAGVVTAPLVRTDLVPTDEPLTCMELSLGWPLRTEGFLDAHARVCVESKQIHRTTLTRPF